MLDAEASSSPFSKDMMNNSNSIQYAKGGLRTRRQEVVIRARSTVRSRNPGKARQRKGKAYSIGSERKVRKSWKDRDYPSNSEVCVTEKG